MKRHGQHRVGIDLGARYVKIAWTSGHRDKLSATASVCIPRGDDDESRVFKRVSKILRRAGVHSPVCGLLLPNEQMHAAIVEVPPRKTEAPRYEIAVNEFHRQLGFPPGTFQTTHADLPLTTRKETAEPVMVCGIDHKSIDSLCRAAVDAGLDLVYAGPPAAALFLNQGAHSGTAGVLPLVDAGWSSARLLLLYQQQVILRRTIPELGVQRMLTTFGEGRSLDPEALEPLLMDTRPEERAALVDLFAPLAARWAANLMEEIRVALSYANHRYPSDSTGMCMCTGGGLLIPGIVDALRAASLLPLTLMGDSTLAHGQGVLGYAAEALSRQLAQVQITREDAA